MRRIAQDYANSVGRGEIVLVISPTHLEAESTATAIRRELKARGLVENEDEMIPRLVPRHLTAAERSDPASYERGDVIVFHQNATGHRKGQRITIGDTLPAGIAQLAERFQVYRMTELPIAAGDMVRITANGATKDGRHRLNNGALYQVRGFTRAGDMKLNNGWVVARDFGFLNHGLVVTSHASQGKTVDRIILAESSASLSAASREQFYVSISRGRRSAKIYTHSKRDLRDAIARSDARLGATELVQDLRGATGRAIATNSPGARRCESKPTRTQAQAGADA